MRSIKVLVQKHDLYIEQAIRTRLYDRGTYADGGKIKTFGAVGSFVYSPFTVDLKAEEGQPTDRVTLFNEGELYESFDNKAGSSSFETSYDDNKKDGKVSDNIPDLDEAIMLGDEGIIGLQELIINDLRDDFKQEAREAIFNGFK